MIYFSVSLFVEQWPCRNDSEDCEEVLKELNDSPLAYHATHLPITNRTVDGQTDSDRFPPDEGESGSAVVLNGQVQAL